MLLKAYEEALAVKIEEAISATNVYTRGAWLVVEGTTGQAIKGESLKQTISDTTRVLPVPYLDGATVATDPNRMKQVTGIQIVNTDNVQHTIKVGVEDIGGTEYDKTFVVPVGGSITYGKDFGWELRSATGLRLDIPGANGADGVDGTDGTNGTNGTTGVATTVEQNLGTAAVFSGKFTVTDASVTALKKILCWQAPGPYTGKGTRADEAAMAPVLVSAVEPYAGGFRVFWQSAPRIVVSPIQTVSQNLGNGALAANGSNRDLQFRATRLGRVRGNIKFSYLVLS